MDVPAIRGGRAAAPLEGAQRDHQPDGISAQALSHTIDAICDCALDPG